MHKISLRYLPFLQTFGHLMRSRHTYHEPDPHWRARVCDVGSGMVTAANFTLKFFKVEMSSSVAEEECDFAPLLLQVMNL